VLQLNLYGQAIEGKEADFVKGVMGFWHHLVALYIIR